MEEECKECQINPCLWCDKHVEGKECTDKTCEVYKQLHKE